MCPSALVFDPKTGLKARDTSAIRAAVVADWQEAFYKENEPTLNTAPTSPAGQLIDSETAIIEDKNAQVLFLSNMFNPSVSEGIWQDALGQIYFLDRQLETPTTVTCVVTGLRGTRIPAGSIIRTTDNYALLSLDEVVIPNSGTTSVVFATEETGSITIGANTATRIVTVIPGWDSVNNPTVGVPGQDRETRASFERRRYASVAANSHGTVAALYGAIGNLPGVVDLSIIENYTSSPIIRWGVTINGHSVFITVYGGEGEAIAEQIYRKKDLGCGTDGNTVVSYTDLAVPIYTGNYKATYNIERPEPLDFYIQVIIQRTDDMPANIVDTIKSLLLANFNGTDEGVGRVRIASNVYSSRFFCPLTSNGIINVVSLLIGTSPTDLRDSVTVNADRVPVLSVENISVIII